MLGQSRRSIQSTESTTIMNPSTSPMCLHVNRKVPVHLHVSTSPSHKKSTGGSVRRMKASDWVKSSTSKGPWVPPPAKTAKTRMSWDGPTHRLEIVPGEMDESTQLHFSDLGGTDIILEPEHSDTHTKLDSLKTEVNNLKTEVELQRSLKELEDKEIELRTSRKSLRDKKIQLQNTKEDLFESEKSRRKLHSSMSHLKEGIDDSSMINTSRELLLKRILDAELDVGTVNRQMDLLRDSLRLLIRDRSLSPTRAREVTEQSRLLQDQLNELYINLKSLKKLLRSQQTHETKMKNLMDDWEVLLHRLTEAETTVQVLRSQLEDKERLAQHSHELHNQLSTRETEVQTLNIRIQSLEDKLQQKESEYARLQAVVWDTKRQAVFDKDSLKKTTKQHKERALNSEKSVETLSQCVDELKSELEFERNHSSKLSREKAHSDVEIRSITSQVKDLQEALEECRRTSKASLDAFTSKLSDKTAELNALHTENENMKALINSLESKLRINQSSSESKMSLAHSEAVELQSTISQYESLLNDYKTQLERSHKECDELAQELRRKEQELDQTQHDSFIEMEKSKMKFQQQITNLEPLADKLKSTEIQLKESKEKLVIYEQRNTDQAKIIAEISARSDHQSSSVESLKEKLHERKAEKMAALAKVQVLEKRVEETEQQNRELIAITAKKEEMIQHFQRKEQNLIEEVASLNRELDSFRAESRRQIEDMREKGSSKERATQSRITDLEAQLSRATSQCTQQRKAKEEVERKLHSRLHDLQERLDQSQATKKSLENYVNFLKSSYSSIFNDTTTSRLSPVM